MTGEEPWGSIDRLRERLRAELRVAIARLAEVRSVERVHAFSLAAHPLGVFLAVAIGTEERLDRVAERTRKTSRSHGRLSLEQSRDRLRWCWDPDWLIVGCEESSRLAQDIVNRFDDAGTRAVFMVCAGTLAALDAAGELGRGEERSAFAVVIDTGDRSGPEELLGWARQLNPQDVVERLEGDLEREARATELLLAKDP